SGPQIAVVNTANHMAVIANAAHISGTRRSDHCDRSCAAREGSCDRVDIFSTSSASPSAWNVLDVLMPDVAPGNHDEGYSDRDQRDRDAWAIDPPTSVAAPPSMSMTATAKRARSRGGVSFSFTDSTSFAHPGSPT